MCACVLHGFSTASQLSHDQAYFEVERYECVVFTNVPNHVERIYYCSIAEAINLVVEGVETALRKRIIVGHKEAEAFKFMLLYYRLTHVLCIPSNNCLDNYWRWRTHSKLHCCRYICCCCYILIYSEVSLQLLY